MTILANAKKLTTTLNLWQKKRMTSASKIFNTIFSCPTAILKPGMAEVQNKVLDKTKGTKGGNTIPTKLPIARTKLS